MKEQANDDSKKEYCETSLNKPMTRKKDQELSISDSEVAIEEMEGSINKLQEEVEALEAGIKAFDKAVAVATEQRKAENTEYKDLASPKGHNKVYDSKICL